MSIRRPPERKWHKTIPVECNCDFAWRLRGLVDDRCYHHRFIEAIEDLRDAGWTVEP